MSKKNRSSARKRQAERTQQKQQQQFVQIGAVVLIIAVIGLIAFFSFSSGDAPAVAQARLELDPYLGNPDASVTIIEYGAYGCEACKQWHEAGVVEQLLDEFPNQVKFIYRDLPIIMPQWSQEMGEVAQCALDQGQEQFWLMHDAIYHQTRQGASTQLQAIQLGGNLGLDVSDLRACVDANTHYNTVQYDLQRPEARGIYSTPTWFVNEQRVFEASPATLRQLISAALNT